MKISKIDKNGVDVLRRKKMMDTLPHNQLIIYGMAPKSVATSASDHGWWVHKRVLVYSFFEVEIIQYIIKPFKVW